MTTVDRKGLRCGNGKQVTGSLSAFPVLWKGKGLQGGFVYSVDVDVDFPKLLIPIWPKGVFEKAIVAGVDLTF